MFFRSTWQMVAKISTVILVFVRINSVAAQECHPYYTDIGRVSLQWYAMRWAVYDDGDGDGPTVYKVSWYTNFIERLSHGVWKPLSREGLWPDVRTTNIFTMDGPQGPKLYLNARHNPNGHEESKLFRWNKGSWIDERVGLVAIDGWISVGKLQRIDFGNGPTLYASAIEEDPPYPLESSIVEFRGGHWTSIGGLDGHVNSMFVMDGPKGPLLYAVGSFQFIGGIRANGIAWWDGARWHGNSEVPHFDGQEAIVANLGDGPHIYARGTLYDEWDVYGIFRWNSDHWTFVGAPDPLPPPSTPPYMTHLGVFDDGRGEALYVTGAFRGFSGVTARNIARYDGHSFESLGAGIVGEPEWLGAFRDIRGWSLFIGGDVMNGAGGGVLRQAAALWVGCKEPTCYANCDLSSSPSRLSTGDFDCFMNAYNRTDPYANCDGNEVINASDLQCFANKFAAACPN